jgi:hypothetical protein
MRGKTETVSVEDKLLDLIGFASSESVSVSVASGSISGTAVTAASLAEIDVGAGDDGIDSSRLVTGRSTKGSTGVESQS